MLAKDAPCQSILAVCTGSSETSAQDPKSAMARRGISKPSALGGSFYWKGSPQFKRHCLGAFRFEIPSSGEVASYLGPARSLPKAVQRLWLI